MMNDTTTETSMAGKVMVLHVYRALPRKDEFHRAPEKVNDIILG